MKNCRFCAEDIQDAALVCRYGGRLASSSPTSNTGAPGRLRSIGSLIRLVVFVGVIAFIGLLALEMMMRIGETSNLFDFIR